MFGFGSPKQRRLSMQFGYEARPSFWQGVSSNAHLIIAAVGTASLLCVAAVALWLAFPGSDRLAVAGVETPVAPKATPAIVADAAAEAVVPARPEASEPEVPQPAAQVKPPATAQHQPAARKADEVKPKTVAQAAPSALSPSNPRWTDPDEADAPPQPAEKPAAAQAHQPARPARAFGRRVTP